MLCEELSLRVSTLLKGLIRRHTQRKKKKNIEYTANIILVFQSILECTPRLHSKIFHQCLSAATMSFRCFHFGVPLTFEKIIGKIYYFQNKKPKKS